MKLTALLFGVAAFLALPIFVLAQTGVPSPDDFNAFFQIVVKAFHDKNWFLLGVLIGIGVVWAVRRYGARLPFLAPYIQRRRWGAVLALLVAFLPQIALAIVNGTFGVETILDALSYAVGMIGGYVGFKGIIFDEPSPTKGEIKVPQSSPVDPATGD